ncbi:MAG TPA: sulfite exporter TauE/SafE family protein [Egibacteraceae bacterium]
MDRRGTLVGIGLGLITGVTSGLFGIGGGAVLVPLLVLVLRMPQHRAHATSLAAIILTAAAGMIRFAGGSSVDFGAGAAIAAGAVLGAYAGAAIMHRLSAQRLRQAFAVLLAVVSIQLLVGGEVTQGTIVLSGAAMVSGYVVLGLVAGVLSALMGVGGGVIMVPAMVLLFGFTQQLAEGTSLLIVIPTAVVGAVRHARNGYTDWAAGFTLGIGGIVGALVGASVALTLDATLLQRFFGAFLLLTALHLLWSARPRRYDPATPTAT